MIQLGSLVRSRNNNLGIGKVKETNDQSALVEYFCSVGNRLEKTLPLISLTRVIIQRQTRCYIKLENQDRWAIGRIFAWDEDNSKYQIDLPDNKTELVNEPEVYIRCNIPIEDPIDIIAMKGQETPYFHERRFSLAQSLISQRAVSHGMTGLLSANIKFYPHQIEVIRRVLEDSTQRYLLADDVGLGKTIEAGVILRQYLLDEPQKKALVLVPRYLLQQWHQELENKFYISHFPDRVKLLAVEDIDKVNRNAEIGCLILDEAHLIAVKAYSLDASIRKDFAVLKQLAHQCDRLLLLSATPLLHHEKEYLAMLHLLDSDSHRLDDLKSFRLKVQNRAAIGQVLLSLQQNANSSELTSNLNQLRTIFAEDNYLLNLANELENSSQTNVDQNEIIKKIRNHLSDTYRLDRRMLRNRIDAIKDVINERNITPKAEYDLDERSIDIHELLEKWRTVAPKEKQYQRIFLLLFRASGTWLGILEQVITGRLNKLTRKELIQEFGDESVTILANTPKFDGEEEILQSLLKIIRQPSEDGDRIELLKTVLLYHLSERFNLQSYRSNIGKLLEQVQRRITRPIPGDTLPKIVIFTNFVQGATEIIRCLRNSFGQVTVASQQLGQNRLELDKNLKQFKIDPRCFILVCDSFNDEAPNLQFADWMIHFDLPWSPNRLEQILNGIDTIVEPSKVEFTVFAGGDLEDSPHDAWYRLLKEGLKIFNQSISNYQFYIDEKLPELEAKLFDGANGLLESIEQIQTEIAQEQIKLSQQNILDEIDVSDEDASQYFTALDNYDAQYQEMQRAVEGWICDALEFKQVYHPDLSGIQRYQPTMRTLVPVDELRTYFTTFGETFGTFNRKLANENSDIKLYRIGEEFVESLASYIRWDDRGQAFAMWRHDKSWDKGKEWFGFRFNYVIETNLGSYATDDTKSQIIKRGADGLFPPIIKSIFLDARNESSMCVVEDEELLNILQLPYRGKGGSSYRDYNLAKSRLTVLDNFVESSKWQDFCYHAHETSLELLYQSTDFVEMCEKNAEIAEEKLGHKVEQLRLRFQELVRSNTLYNSEIESEIESESELMTAIVEGIRDPSIRLDSVGFMIVSGQAPTQFGEEGND